MTRKNRFTMSIVVLTILLIGFLTVVFMMGVFLSLKGFSSERLGLLVISIGLGAIVVRKMVIMNREETRARIKDVVDDKYDFIQEWNIEAPQWRDFIDKQLEFEMKDSINNGLVLGLIVGLIAGFISSSQLEILQALILGGSAFLLFFIIGKYGSVAIAKSKFKKYAQTESGQVHFAKEVIVLNNQLMILDDFGTRLISFKKENRFDMEVFSFTVQMGIGHRKTSRLYTVPIPSDKSEEAERLCQYYSGMAG